MLCIRGASDNSILLLRYCEHCITSLNIVEHGMSCKTINIVHTKCQFYIRTFLPLYLAEKNMKKKIHMIIEIYKAYAFSVFQKYT